MSQQQQPVRGGGNLGFLNNIFAVVCRETTAHAAVCRVALRVLLASHIYLLDTTPERGGGEREGARTTPKGWRRARATSPCCPPRSLLLCTL